MLNRKSVSKILVNCLLLRRSMSENQKENQDPIRHIIVKGARVHNLKNVSLTIPRNKLIVFTGLSGSGKSSLAMDTLYAEGQRRYVESLSSYARQFLGKLNKPEVDYIQGISPAIAVEQKVNTSNPRSTVGTSSEIYDYLKLLFSRIGKTFSPVSGEEVIRYTPDQIILYINSHQEGDKVTILAPLNIDKIIKSDFHLGNIRQMGFSRLRINGTIERIEEIKNPSDELKNKKVELLIDRASIKPMDEENTSRLTDSVQTAFFQGDDECIIEIINRENHSNTKKFSARFEADGMHFEQPDINFFSFNNPFGACKTCEGFGSVIGIDENLVVPDKSLSLYEGCVAPWKGEKMGEWKNQFLKNAMKFDFPVHRAYHDLNEIERKLLWEGNKHAKGIKEFFKMVEDNTYKIQYRVMLSRYRGKTTCPDCKGTRLRKDAGYVRMGDKSIIDLVLMPVNKLKIFFENLQLTDHENNVAKRILLEIKSRLDFLCDVGLGYLTLNRQSSSLSGGESQRINLATSLGSSLEGALYILDEPSIGLHSKDTERLISVLGQLRDGGNTVVVVEHDEDIIRAADYIVDMGPEAGRRGGELVFQGKFSSLTNTPNSLTADYLLGRKNIETKTHYRKWLNSIEIKGAREHNLKHIDVRFPLNIMTVVTGVSGSGKSTLVNRILYPALKKMFDGYTEPTGQFDRIKGDFKLLEAIEYVDQNPIGKSSRSNPVTYVKAYDDIRALYSSMPLASTRGYKPSMFSFNVEGGRCEECEGEGFVTISMQFMADIKLSCDECGGRRFKNEILEVEYQGKSIFELLELTVDEALAFFGKKESAVEKRIKAKLQCLADVGLGYVQLGQASSTLSGGEAQRIKLASFLTLGNQQLKTLFIFDEPTTGLHFHDIKKLLDAFSALIQRGHTLVVIEHNLDVIKNADWIIDLGPEGGEGGGNLVFEGVPSDLIKQPESWTGKFLKEKFYQESNP